MAAVTFQKAEMMTAFVVRPGQSIYPPQLTKRMGIVAPREISTLGNLDLVVSPKIALFCSARCPGNAILTAYDQAAKWRDTGRCVISGFHSPVEKECLRILLRGTQPVIICPARALPRRLPNDWKTHLAAGRLLVLSAFGEKGNRTTTDLAARRNEIVAALADEVFIVHATPGGNLDKLISILELWKMRVRFASSTKLQ